MLTIPRVFFKENINELTANDSAIKEDFLQKGKTFLKQLSKKADLKGTIDLNKVGNASSGEIIFLTTSLKVILHQQRGKTVLSCFPMESLTHMYTIDRFSNPDFQKNLIRELKRWGGV